MVPADLGILPNSVDIMPTKFGHFPSSNTPFRAPSFTEQAKFSYSIVASTNSSSISGPHAVDNNNFSDSLAAGWWNNPILSSDSDQSQLLNLPETLSSIFNSFPNEIESLASSSSSSVPESEVETCNADIPNPQFLLNELQCVVNSTPKLAVDNNVSSVLNQTVSTASTVFTHGNKPSPVAVEHEKIKPETISVPMPIANMLDSVSHTMSVFNESTYDNSRKHHPIPDNAFAVSGINTSFNVGVIQAPESICTQVNQPLESNKCSSTSKKRSSSIFTFSNGVPSPNAWTSQMGFISSKEQIMSHCHVLDNADTMLYKTDRGNPNGLQYYMTVEDGTVCLDEELMIKPPPPKSRKRHGTAMDPQSVAARSRRERFSDRIRILQSLIPNGERLDTVSMLGQTLEYVRFLQHQVWQLYHGMEPATPSNVCEKWKDFVEADSASKK